jgi:putative MATE family efflux protein
MKLTQKDLTVGTPWKVLLLFSLPIFLGNLVQMAYVWIDGIFVGALGEAPLAAIGASANIIYPATVFAQGLPIGLGNYTSQLFGAKDENGVRRSYATSIVLNLVAGLVLTLATVLLVPAFLKAGNLTPGTDVYEYSMIYMYIMLGGLLGIFFLNFYLNFLRAIGDASMQFWIIAIYTVINIFFDWILIPVAHLGVMGSALAYVISTVLISLISMVWVYFKYPNLRLKKSDFKMEWPFIQKHLRIALPLAVQFSILAIGVMIMQGAVDSYGQAAINGYYAGSKIDNLLCTFIIAYGYSLGAYCGQNYGAKQYKRVKDGVTQSFVVWAIQTAVLMLVTFLVKDKAASFFLASPDADTVEYCRIYLYWDIAGYGLLSLIYLGRNALQGIGKPLVSFISGISEFVGRVLGSLVFVIPFGAVAALGAQSMAWMVAGIINLIGLIIYIYANPLYKKNEPLEQAKLAQKHSSIVK